MVANYSSGSAALLPILADGALGEASDVVQHQGSSGANPQRQKGPHAHSTILSPDERFVFVADLGLDQVVIYQFSTRPPASCTHTAT